MSKYVDLELLIQVGEYKAGEDEQADAAIQKRTAISQFLQQDVRRASSYQDSLNELSDLVQS